MSLQVHKGEAQETIRILQTGYGFVFLLSLLFLANRKQRAVVVTEAELQYIVACVISLSSSLIFVLFFITLPDEDSKSRFSVYSFPPFQACSGD